MAEDVKRSDDEVEIDAGIRVRPRGLEAAAAKGSASSSPVSEVDYKDRWLRAEAELQNVRARARRDVDDARRSAEEAVLLDLVSWLDDLERAVDAARSSGAAVSWVEGVALVLQKGPGIPERMSVTASVDPSGLPFDPALHEAVLEVDPPENVAGGTVAGDRPGLSLREHAVAARGPRGGGARVGRRLMAKRDYYEVAGGASATRTKAPSRRRIASSRSTTIPIAIPATPKPSSSFKRGHRSVRGAARSRAASALRPLRGTPAWVRGCRHAGADFSASISRTRCATFMRDFGGDMGGFEDSSAAAVAASDRRGDDLQVRLVLSLEEIATGIEKNIRVKHERACTTCQGRGGSGETTCPQCSGRGQIRRVQQSFFGQFVNVATCPRCEGAGRSSAIRARPAAGTAGAPRTRDRRGAGPARSLHRQLHPDVGEWATSGTGVLWRVI